MFISDAPWRHKSSAALPPCTCVQGNIEVNAKHSAIVDFSCELKGISGLHLLNLTPTLAFTLNSLPLTSRGKQVCHSTNKLLAPLRTSITDMLCGSIAKVVKSVYSYKELFNQRSFLSSLRGSDCENHMRNWFLETTHFGIYNALFMLYQNDLAENALKVPKKD